MTVHVSDLMEAGVVVAQADHTADYVRRQMRTLEIHAVPVADGDGRPIGIVRAGAFLGDTDPETPVTELMDREVVSAELGTDARLAARMMVQHRSHHLVVTDAGSIVGIVSAFDFLETIASKTPDPKSDAFKTGAFAIGTHDQ